MIKDERIAEVAEDKLHGIIQLFPEIEPYVFDFARALLAEVSTEIESPAIEINDYMAISFHSALTDSSPGEDEIEDIKTGLKAAFANISLQDMLREEEEFIRENAHNIFVLPDGFIVGLVSFRPNGFKLYNHYGTYETSASWENYYQCKKTITREGGA